MEILQFAQFTAAWLMSRVRSRVEIGSERGATAVEYGIMVALIAAIIVATVALLGTQIRTAFCTVLTSIGGTCP